MDNPTNRRQRAEKLLETLSDHLFDSPQWIANFDSENAATCLDAIEAALAEQADLCSVAYSDQYHASQEDGLSLKRRDYIEAIRNA